MSFQTIIAAVGMAMAVLSTLIGLYTRITNELALMKLRIDQLEKQAEQSEDRINAHDDKIHAMLLELKDDISTLKIIIEQKFNRTNNNI